MHATPRLQLLDLLRSTAVTWALRAAPNAEAAHKRKGAAQRNSAIALARMAKLPACLRRIRELHGVEIMCRYVKP